MKAIIQNYTYSKVARTITLTDFSATRPVVLERLLMVVDATLGEVIYNATDNTVATASVSSNNVVTLSTVPGASADADKLTVIYDTLPGDPQSAALTGAYTTGTTVLSTELDALGNASNTVASSAFDNSTTRYPLADMQVFVAAQGGARSAGAALAVYMTTRGDGTNFDSVNETTAELVAVVPLDAATTARRRTVRGISLPPEQVKFFARNLTGQSLAASASTVILRPYYAESA